MLVYAGVLFVIFVVLTLNHNSNSEQTMYKPSNEPSNTSTNRATYESNNTIEQPKFENPTNKTIEPKHTTSSSQIIEHQSTPPQSTQIEEPIEEPIENKPVINKSNFQCDGRIHCSQMTSCEEATFFLKNCPGVQMDGGRPGEKPDGVPCENQWCIDD